MTAWRGHTVAIVVIVLLGVCATFSSCSRPVTPVLRDVRVRLDWTPWAPHAAFYAAAAQDQGYFEKEGLRVKMYVPPDPEATAKLVAAGQDDLGISYMTDTILAREQGFKVLSVAALIAHPLNSIMTLKTSGIDVPAKLKGKVIGTTGVPSDQAFLDTVLERNGVKKGEYKLVNIGFNLAQALTSKQVDAIIGAYWPWEGVKLEQDGVGVNVMRLQELGVPDYYELVLITRDELAKRDPELLRKFLRALVKGQSFVREHPDKAVEILRGVSPDLSSKFLATSLAAVLPLMEFQGGPFRQAQGTWDGVIGFMTANGLLKTSVDASSVFTNQYLPE